ncbi:MAG: hypothetical protein WCC53_12965 [Thermoanaerobaculia bacterium]
MTLAPGTKLGAYEILDQIGAGGMGEVYRAKDTRLARDPCEILAACARRPDREMYFLLVFSAIV